MIEEEWVFNFKKCKKRVLING